MDKAIIQKNVSLSITFSIRESKCLTFSLTDYALKNKNSIPFNGYHFDFVGNNLVHENEKQFTSIIEAKFFEKKSENVRMELGEIKAQTVFLIENFGDVLKKENNQFLIPDQLFSLCNGITMSTMRGMLIIKLENTIYSNLIIPVIDPKTLIPGKTINS